MRQNLLLLLALPLTSAMADDYDSRFSGTYGAPASTIDSAVSRDVRAGGPGIPASTAPDIPALPVDSRPIARAGFHFEPDGSVVRDNDALPRTGNLGIDADEISQRANCERIQQHMLDQRKSLPSTFSCD